MSTKYYNKRGQRINEDGSPYEEPWAFDLTPIGRFIETGEASEYDMQKDFLLRSMYIQDKFMEEKINEQVAEILRKKGL